MCAYMEFLSTDDGPTVKPINHDLQEIAPDKRHLAKVKICVTSFTTVYYRFSSSLYSMVKDFTVIIECYCKIFYASFFKN